MFKSNTDNRYYCEVGDVIKIPRRRGIYVVESAKMDGGGISMFNDIFPDAWTVIARLLIDNKYDPTSKVITFTQHTTCYNNKIDGIKKVGKMMKSVNFKYIKD